MVDLKKNPNIKNNIQTWVRMYLHIEDLVPCSVGIGSVLAILVHNPKIRTIHK